MRSANLDAIAPGTLLSQAKILAVDDELVVRKMLTILLAQQGISCRSVGSAPEALEILQRESIDAVISDLRMSGTSGMELLRNVNTSYPNVAFIMATGVADLRVAVQAMKEGADDYLLKPFDSDLVITSLTRALQHKQLERELERYRHNLEHMVAERTEQLQSAVSQIQQTYGAMLESFGAAIDLRDGPTAGHSRRVLCYSLRLADKLRLSDRQRRTLAVGAWLHDIGKLAIPDHILLKPGPLTDAERKVMQRHAQIGFELIQQIPFLSEAAEVIHAHHERFDGAGYPAGLRAEQIPLCARIFAVADTLDAMTSDRPYRNAGSFAQARAVISTLSGTQFDPVVVRAFLGIPDTEWQQLRSQETSVCTTLTELARSVDGPQLARHIPERP